MSLLEAKHAAEFLLSEFPGTLSREVAVLGGEEGTAYEPGTILVRGEDNEVIALSDLDGVEGVAGTEGDSDNSEVSEVASEAPQDVVGVLLVAGVAGDEAPYIARLAEVKLSALVASPDAVSDLDMDEVVAALAALDIIAR